METTRPRANRRLRQALEGLIRSRESISRLGIAELLGRISALSNDKRFLIFAIILQRDEGVSSQEIAKSIGERHSSVLRHIHVLIAEKLVLVRTGDTDDRTYAVDRETTRSLASFLDG